MGQILINRDALNSDENHVNLRIKLPLTSSGDTVIDEHKTSQTKSICDVKTTDGCLFIEIQSKLKKGDYGKVLAKAYTDKDIKKIIQSQAKLENDKAKRAAFELYNEFRLTWIGMLLSDEAKYTTAAFPTAIGANDIWSEVANFDAIRQSKISDADLHAAGKAVGKTALAGAVGAGTVAGGMTVAGAAGGVVATGTAAGATAAGLATTFGAGAAATASSAALAGVTAVGVAGVATVAAVPVIAVAGTLLMTKLILGANQDLVNAAVENSFKLLTQPNISTYLQQNDLSGAIAFRELNNLSPVLGGKTLVEMEEAIKDFI